MTHPVNEARLRAIEQLSKWRPHKIAGAVPTRENVDLMVQDLITLANIVDPVVEAVMEEDHHGG